jgi:hypothetical protein
MIRELALVIIISMIVQVVLQPQQLVAAANYHDNDNDDHITSITIANSNSETIEATTTTDTSGADAYAATAATAAVDNDNDWPRLLPGWRIRHSQPHHVVPTIDIIFRLRVKPFSIHIHI